MASLILDNISALMAYVCVPSRKVLLIKLCLVYGTKKEKLIKNYAKGEKMFIPRGKQIQSPVFDSENIFFFRISNAIVCSQ